MKLLSSLLLLGIAGIATTTAAQNTDEDQTELALDPNTCESLSSASRTRQACGDEEQQVLRAERELTIFREAVSLETLQCESLIEIEYDQRGAATRVTGVIRNDTCPASRGEYQVEARIRHDDGEIEVLVFDETWQREDDQPIEFTEDYPIGDNVDLVRVRTRGLQCTCSVPQE